MRDWFRFIAINAAGILKLLDSSLIPSASATNYKVTFLSFLAILSLLFEVKNLLTFLIHNEDLEALPWFMRCNICSYVVFYYLFFLVVVWMNRELNLWNFRKTSDDFFLA